MYRHTELQPHRRSEYTSHTDSYQSVCESVRHRALRYRVYRQLHVYHPHQALVVCAASRTLFACKETAVQVARIVIRDPVWAEGRARDLEGPRVPQTTYGLPPIHTRREAARIAGDTKPDSAARTASRCLVAFVVKND